MLYIFRYGTCTLIVVCRALLLRVVRFFLAVPAKKHLLMKWEKSQSGQENVCGSAVPPTRPHPPQKGGDRNSSPLFDEVSSEGEDFEVADRGGSRRHALGLSSSDVRRRSHSQTAAAQAFPPPKDSDPPLHAPDVVHVGNEEEESVVVVVGPRTPLGNDDCSMDSCYSRPTDEDDANNSLDSSVVVGKADVDYHRGACGEVGPRIPPPLPVDGVAVARQTADSCEGTRALVLLWALSRLAGTVWMRVKLVVVGTMGRVMQTRATCLKEAVSVPSGRTRILPCRPTISLATREAKRRCVLLQPYFLPSLPPLL